MNCDIATPEPVSVENVKLLRQLFLGIFPTQYSYKFYKEIIDNPDCKVWMMNNQLICAVCCQPKLIGCRKMFYIMALGVSPLLRKRGHGSQALIFVEERARVHCLDLIALHVQVNNDAAIKFYHKHGFKIEETIENYYKRCQPSSSYLMIKEIA